MSNRLIKIIVGSVLTLSVGFLVFATKNFSDENKFFDDDNSRDTIVTTVSAVNTLTQQDITLSQIAQHNSRASCWSSINDEVYDLTSWIPNHPGGEKNILSLCGKDGSAGYNARHKGKSKIMTILSGFKIGTLAI